MPPKEPVYVASRKSPGASRKPAKTPAHAPERRHARRPPAPARPAHRHDGSGGPQVSRRTPPWLEPALEAALEAIPRAAFLVDPLGNVVRANDKGKKRMGGEDHDKLLAGLQAAQRGAGSGFDVTPLKDAGAGHVLAVEREDLENLVLRLAHRYGLTRMQLRVLTQMADGLQNWAIARELGISERTVESHVTGIFDRLGVETRAGAIAVVLSFDPSRT